MMYEYTGIQWLFFFFCYCFFGWIFESAYVSLKERHFVNRGFLRLPMLPLYGTGAVMMLFVSLPVKDNLVLVYFSGVFAATLLEYVTGWGMEKLFKMRYWDYSSQRFQLHGYICLTSSIAWGFLTIFLTEVIHRPIERWVLGMNSVAVTAAVVAVGIVFTADVIESTKAALDLGRALEAMTRMKAEMEEMQVQLSLLKSEFREQLEVKVAAAHGEAALRAEEIFAEAAERLNGIKESSAARAVELTEAVLTELKEEMTGRLETWKEGVEEQVEGWKEEVEEHLENLREDRKEYLEQRRQKARELAEKLLRTRERLSVVRKQYLRAGRSSSRLQAYYQKAILNGNPTAFSRKHKDALDELRTRIKNDRDKTADREDAKKR